MLSKLAEATHSGGNDIVFSKRYLTVQVRLILAAAVVLVTTLAPYLFPGTRSVSVAYLVHFNNKVCVLVFIALAYLFANVTSGDLGTPDNEEDDQRLTWPHLVGALSLTTLLIVLQRFGGPDENVGQEIIYNLSRLQLLMSGLKPYLQFEYAYGPLNLYVPFYFAKGLHISAPRAYNLYWSLEWLVGVSLIWYTTRRLTNSLPWRATLFWSYLVYALLSLQSEGLAYTPMRNMGTACFVLLAHRALCRWQITWPTVTFWVLLVLLAFGISPEQGFALVAGLLAWLAALTFRARAQVQSYPALTFTVLVLGVCLFLLRSPYCYTLRQFSEGAYSFPLTLSLPLTFILLTYLCAACAGYKAYRNADFSSQAIPLLLTGCVLLPVAFGRCDIGHALFAAPALFLGFAAVQSHTVLRRWWTYTFLLLFSVPAMFALFGSASSQFAFIRQTKGSRAAAAAATRQVLSSGSIDARYSSVPDAALQAPCSTVYRVIDIIPDPNQPDGSTCMTPGFFSGFENVFTDAALRRKIGELEANPKQPLLLLDKPLYEQFIAEETDPGTLRRLQGALYVPHARYAPYNYQPMNDYVRNHYEADAKGFHGYRIWRRKNPGSSATAK